MQNHQSVVSLICHVVQSKNSAGKDFFGLKVNAFGFVDGILKAKFTLNAKTENYKGQKQVITGYLDDEESDDFRDDIEY